MGTLRYLLNYKEEAGITKVGRLGDSSAGLVWPVLDWMRMLSSCVGAASQERGSEIVDARLGKQDQRDWTEKNCAALTGARNTLLSVVSVSASRLRVGAECSLSQDSATIRPVQSIWKMDNRM